jgi:3'-5' exoribonuclease
MIKNSPLKRLRHIIGAHLTDEQQKVCNAALNMEKFQTWPASTSKHHVWEGGLAEHTCQVVGLSMLLAAQSNLEHAYSHEMEGEIDMQVVIMAAIFHDLGKIDDYDVSEITNADGSKCYERRFEKTDHYSLIHHVVKSSDYFIEFSKGLLSKDVVDQVRHCILAHHGRLEYGSPVEPVTKEAWVVHLADMASVHCIEERKES